jgi:sortase A
MKFRSLSDLKYAFWESEQKAIYWRIFLLRTVGNILILGSIAYVFMLFYPVLAAEVSFRTGQLGNREAPKAEIPVAQQVVDRPESSPLSSLLPRPSASLLKLPELKEKPVDTQFGILIEKIGANAKIVSDVDPYDSKAYENALKMGVAHAEGTVYPGQVGNTYLFAHNTLNPWDIPRYNAVFFLLHNLEPGDRISTFYEGQRYDYIVFDKNVHKPTDLSPLETKYSEPVLSLQTCWPPGTTWQRLVVRAKLVR